MQALSWQGAVIEPTKVLKVMVNDVIGPAIPIVIVIVDVFMTWFRRPLCTLRDFTFCGLTLKLSSWKKRSKVRTQNQN